MRRFCLILLLMFLFSTVVSAGILDNTPFDPKTWQKAIKNTPFDPNTWTDFAEDLANPAGIGCEFYAKDLASRYESTRGLNYTEKYYLRPWFGDIVDKVTVFWGAPRLNPEIKGVSVSASAQTFGYRLYFKLNFRTWPES